jgi:hypothetical protein
VPAQTPRTETLRTENGTAVRTDAGWVWLCEHCSVTAEVYMESDAQFDARRWVESIDATHYCEHKARGGA